MKGRWFAGAVVCATVVLALAATTTAAEPGKSADVKVKVIKEKSPAAGAWLGVQLQDVTRSVSRAMGLKSGAGALIADVVDGSPADEAGLQDGDVVTKFNGKSVRDASDLTDMVRGQKPGSEVKLTAMRDGTAKTFKVKLGDLADQSMTDDQEAAPGDEGDNTWVWHGKNAPGDRQMRVFKMRAQSAYLGVELQGLTEQLGDFFGVKDGKGALISRVVEDSPAEAAGLKAGDVITRINDEAVENPSDVTEQISDAEPGDSVEVTYVSDRGHGEKTVAVKLAKPPAGQGMMMLNDGNMPNVYLRQMPRMRQYLQDMDAARGGTPDRQQMRQQMQELRQQMQELKDQLQEMRDQMHQEGMQR
jgi:serine protease Do